MPAPLLQVRGTGTWKDQTWYSNDSLRVGRESTSNVRIVDDSISRRHAEFVHSDQGWIVRDLGSTNGTELNGLRLGRTDYKIHLGDIVKCGAVNLIIDQLVERESDPQASGFLNRFQFKEVTRKDCRDAVESFAMDVTK